MFCLGVVARGPAVEKQIPRARKKALGTTKSDIANYFIGMRR